MQQVASKVDIPTSVLGAVLVTSSRPGIAAIVGKAGTVLAPVEEKSKPSI